MISRKPCPFCGGRDLRLLRNGAWTQCNDCKGKAPTKVWEGDHPGDKCETFHHVRSVHDEGCCLADDGGEFPNCGCWGFTDET